MVTREAIERIIQGPQADVFRCFFEQLNEIDSTTKDNAEAIASWPARCAEHRLALTERIANGKMALGIPTATNGNGKTITIPVIGVKVQAKTFWLALFLAAAMLGPMVLGIALFVWRYGAKLVEVFGA